MPTSTRIDPFSRQPVSRHDLTLRTPQARVLAAVIPADLSLPQFDWPVVTRARLSVKAGYTAISGTVTRALNGIRPGCKSGPPHPGLLVRGMIEEVVLEIEGVEEVNYRITPLGIRAYTAYLEQNGGSIPQGREKSSYVNDRYKRISEESEKI